MNEKTTITLYHGSNRVVDIRDITFPGPRPDCDFGSGFYLTPHQDIAEEWVRNEISPIINVYTLTFLQSQAIILSGENWLKTVLGFREQRYNVTFTQNIIIGAIANDRMNDALPAFCSDTLFRIGDKRLFDCLTLVKLGDQYVLKNNAQGLKFIKHYTLTHAELDAAKARHQARRTGMKTSLLQAHRKVYSNEKFLEDYLEECRHGFTI